MVACKLGESSIAAALPAEDLPLAGSLHADLSTARWGCLIKEDG
jgi:hypothetical protein